MDLQNPFFLLLIGYASYWLSLTYGGGQLLNNFLGRSNYMNLRLSAHLWFAGLFLFCLFASVVMHKEYGDGSPVIIAFIFLGITLGYLHFLYIPERFWSRKK